MVDPEDSGGSARDGRQLTRTSSWTHFTRQAATRSGIQPRSLPSASRPVVPKPKKVKPKDPEEIDDDGNYPLTINEDESCASSQKDDGNQHEETGKHPATGAEDSKESGAMWQPCVTTYAPSSSNDVVDFKKKLESLESTLRNIPRLTFLVEDFGARIENMEAAQGKTERKPPKNRFEPGW